MLRDNTARRARVALESRLETTADLHTKDGETGDKLYLGNLRKLLKVNISALA